MKRRRRFFRLIPLLLLVAILLGHRAGLFRVLQQGKPDSIHPRRYRCDLVEIVDGDTIVIRWQGGTEHIRLLRVNTPEHGQPGYEESGEFLRNLLSGKMIELEFEDPMAPARDRYGRLLAYVFADGENVNVEMVRAGWSAFWTRYGRGKYAEAFEKAQSEADSRKRDVPEGVTEGHEEVNADD
jgi:micrococcal nuclease